MNTTRRMPLRWILAAGAILLASSVALTACSSAQPAGAATAAVTPSATPSASATPTPTPTPTPSAVPADWTLHNTPTPDAHCAGTGLAAPQTGVVHVYISIADQHLWECSGANLMLDSAVTTGASALTNVHDATPTGTFAIAAKTRDTHLRGHDVNGSWDDAVTYWLPFSGGVGLHDSPWQTFPYGSDEYRTQGSHGCVHVPLDAIASLFNTVQVGTRVTIT